MLDQFTQESAEVLYTTAPLTQVGAPEIAILKDRAAQNPRKRCRLCCHAGVSDSVHEMLIVHARDAYVKPHLHLGKSESLHVIEGQAKLVLFSDTGAVTGTLALGNPESGSAFYYRIEAGICHSLLIESEWFVFHETTQGPFDRNQTVWAPWAPAEENVSAVERYIRDIRGAACSNPPSNPPSENPGK